MKLHDLKKEAARAQQELELLGLKMKACLQSAKQAKAAAEDARLRFKQLRKSAKQAKKLALAADERVREQRRVCEKAQKRLTKALRKAAKHKHKARTKAAVKPGSPGNTSTAVKTPSATPQEQKPSVAARSQSVDAALTASPTGV